MRRSLAIVVAVALLAVGTAAQQKRQPDVDLQAAIRTETVDGDLNGAIRQYSAIVAKYKADRAVAATALVRMAECYQKLGDVQARNIYEQIVREYADQAAAAGEARTRLAALAAPGSQTRQTARRIWVGEGVTSDASPSPDGRYLVFVDSATGDVALRNLSTGTNRHLTNTGGWSSGEYGYAPVISPDGGQVAYIWYVDKDSKAELRVASLATGDPVQPKVVLRAAQNDGPYKIAWMPDGKHLLIGRTRPELTSQIGIVTIQDGSFRSIKSLEWRKSNLLSLSPDGRYVAYDVPAGEAGSPRDIFVLATDGSRETAVVRNPADDSFPLWSPDGSRLVFLSDRTGSNGIWAVPIEDGRPNGPAVSIKTDVGSIDLLGITKSGALCYFSVTGGAPRNLYATNLDADHVTSPPVPASERFVNKNVGPAWSRDGEYLAYYSARDTSRDTVNGGVLVVRSAKTGEERTVVLPARTTTRFWAGPKWFPDNRSVLVEAGDARGSGFGFYRLALDSGNTQLLAHLPRNVSSYDLSADGTAIFYAIGTTDNQQKVMRFDIESGRETELNTAEPPFPDHPGWSEVVSLAVSPDGLQLAESLIGGVVEVRPTAGGPAREVFRPATSELGTGALRQALTWTPDQRFLLWIRGDDRTMWKVPAAGGKAEKVGIPMESLIKNIAVHPDGKQVIFEAGGGAGTAEVWAMENFLPSLTANR